MELIRQTLNEGGSVDVEKLKTLCFEHGMPADVRCTVWMHYLGTKQRNTPPPPTDLVPDPCIKDDLELLNNTLNGPLTPEIQQQLQLALHHYCLKKGIPYSHDLCELCGPLLLQTTSPGDVSMMLYVIVERYLAYKYLAESVDNKCRNEVICIIMRQLLQYHDPQLSTHFDQHRIKSELLIEFWNTGLFIRQLGPKSVHMLWDYLFGSSDPLLLFFLALNLIIMNRDSLLNVQGNAELSQALVDLRIGVNAQKVKQWYKEARETQRDTPASICATLVGLATLSPELPVQSIHDKFVAQTCITVSIEDLIEAFMVHEPGAPKRGHYINFIILDCRAEKSFRYARLPTAVHIGTNLGYESEKFQQMTARFKEAKGSHFCVLGTGKELTEEYNLLKLITMQFVNAGYPHIAIADGGFKACIPYIRHERIEYVRSYESLEPQTQRPRPPSQQAAPSLPNVKELAKNLPTVNTKEMADKAAAAGSAVSGFFKKTWGGWGKKGKDSSEPTSQFQDPSQLYPHSDRSAKMQQQQQQQHEAMLRQQAATDDLTSTTSQLALGTSATSSAPSFSLGGDEDEDDFDFEFVETKKPATAAAPETTTTTTTTTPTQPQTTETPKETTTVDDEPSAVAPQSQPPTSTPQQEKKDDGFLVFKQDDTKPAPPVDDPFADEDLDAVLSPPTTNTKTETTTSTTPPAVTPSPPVKAPTSSATDALLDELDDELEALTSTAPSKPKQQEKSAPTKEEEPKLGPAKEEAKPPSAVSLGDDDLDDLLADTPATTGALPTTDDKELDDLLGL